MPVSQPSLAFASTRIESHICSRCRAPMMFAGTKPASLGFDLRMFECVKCGHIENMPTESTRRLPFFEMLTPSPKQL